MTYQRQLFDERFPIRWLPDETVFSLCSRYHVLSGNTTTKETNRILFGRGLESAAHDFPVGIQRLINTSDSELGNIDQIIEKHSVAKAYLPFLSWDRRHSVRDLMAFSGGASTHTRVATAIGARSAGFKCLHPLRQCEDCLASDEKKYGVGYWHLSHQLPGMWICIKHKKPLYVAKRDFSHGLSKSFVLPTSGKRVERHLSDEVIEAANTVRQFWLKFLSATDRDSFNQDRLKKIIGHGFRPSWIEEIHGDKARYSKQTIGRYVELSKLLSTLPDLYGLEVDEANAKRQISKILKPQTESIHPIRFVMIVESIFGGWDGFWMHYSNEDQRVVNFPDIG